MGKKRFQKAMESKKKKEKWKMKAEIKRMIGEGEVFETVFIKSTGFK